jgi:hypothetical protein
MRRGKAARWGNVVMQDLAPFVFFGNLILVEPMRKVINETRRRVEANLAGSL